MQIQFHKMHGLGNDFIIFKDSIEFESLSEDQVKYLCDRKQGIGCDQLIICNKFSDHVKMKIYNNDGSIAAFCGNATRCVASLYLNPKNEGNQKIYIETGNSLLPCNLNNDLTVTVNIGRPLLKWNEIPLSSSIEGNEIELPSEITIYSKRIRGFCINVGNPHIVIFVNNHDFNLNEIGSKIENLNLFPEKINVNFANITDKNNIKLRVWERGAGLTMACGSGACASFYVAYKMNFIHNNAKVSFQIGCLNIKLENENILMTGGYTYVFNGIIKF
jgi:diaminopimelate epimerase